MQLAIRNRRQLVAVAVVAVVAALLPLLTSGPAQAQVVVTIPEIQGAQHTSPFEGVNVATTGVVTALAFNGYYLQDPAGDGNVDTFTFTAVLAETASGLGGDVCRRNSPFPNPVRH